MFAAWRCHPPIDRPRICAQSPYNVTPAHQPPFPSCFLFHFSKKLMSTTTTPRTRSTESSPDAEFALPPTTHAMTHTDRTRLMRSIRKISAVLGETPVVDVDVTASPNLLAPTLTGKRSFFFHASASLSSLALPFHKSDSSSSSSSASPSSESQRHRDADTTPGHDRPALFVRLPDTFDPLPAPLSPGFSPTLLSPDSPCSPSASASAPFSPLSPVAYTPEHTRRLRSAKIARTLGEQVPPALILSSPAPSPAAGVVKRRRRASTLVIPESALEQQVFFAAAGVRGMGLARTASLVGVRPAVDPTLTAEAEAQPDADMQTLTSPLGEVHVHPIPISISMDPDTTLVAPGEWLRTSASRSGSRSASRAGSPAPGTSNLEVGWEAGGDASHSRASSPSPRPPSPSPPSTSNLGVDSEAWASPPPSYAESHAHGPAPFLPISTSSSSQSRTYTIPPPNGAERTREREDAWSGEWRTASPRGETVVGMQMQDVVRGLRGLRVKG
ncbi:hypothetical protein B0H11DRAFT_1993855 [Mycena galericulata]|nr:hypothetical protein B0H11DRAFT_1993855 [Mycena galericulata]